MTNQVINLDTVFSGFDSGTDLQPKNTRTNNQGVKINDIAGFLQHREFSEIPTAAAGTKGDFFWHGDIIYLCKTSFSSSPSVAAVWRKITTAAL